jgi:hypothetical protein
MAFQLDPGLVAWAFRLSKDVALSDTPELRRYRALYVGPPGGAAPTLRAPGRHARARPGTGTGPHSRAGPNAGALSTRRARPGS